MPSVVFDGLYIPGGAASVAALAASPDAVDFVRELYRHCKPLALDADGTALLAAADVPPGGPGVVTAGRARKAFHDAFVAHRFWQRETALG